MTRWGRARPPAVTRKPKSPLALATGPTHTQRPTFYLRPLQSLTDLPSKACISCSSRVRVRATPPLADQPSASLRPSDSPLARPSRLRPQLAPPNVRSDCKLRRLQKCKSVSAPGSSESSGSDASLLAALDGRRGALGVSGGRAVGGRARRGRRVERERGRQDMADT